MAAVSHLPHVLANVLVAQAAGRARRGRSASPRPGPSFRDATRVAGANSAIWTDIYLSNREALVAQIDDADRQRLLEVRGALADGDADAVTAWNDAAAEQRRRLLEAELAGGPAARAARVGAQPARRRRRASRSRSAARVSTSPTWRSYPAPDNREGEIAAVDRRRRRGRARARELVGELGFPVARA